LRVGDPGAVTGRLAAAHDDEEARGRAASGQGPDQVEGGQAAQPRRLLGGAVVGDGGGVQGGELDDAGGRGVGERLVQQPGQLVGVGGVEDVAAGALGGEPGSAPGDDVRYRRVQPAGEPGGRAGGVGEDQPAPPVGPAGRVGAGLPAGFEQGAVQRGQRGEPEVLGLQDEVLVGVPQPQVAGEGVAGEGPRVAGHPGRGGAPAGEPQPAGPGGYEGPVRGRADGQGRGVEGGVEERRVDEVALGGPAGQAGERGPVGAVSLGEAAEGGPVVDAEGGEPAVEAGQVRLPGGAGEQHGGRFAVRRGVRGPGAEASGEVLVPTGAGGRGEDGDVADAVLGGPQDQLEPYRPVVGHAQRAQEGDVGQFGAGAGVERGGGLQDGFQEGGGGQPDLTADPVVGQVG